MATFLTTSRMSPELRARIERAVSHRTRAKHNAARAGLPGTFAGRERLRLARVLPLVALLVVVGLGTATYAYGRHTFEEERASLLAALVERRAGLPEGYEGFVAETDRWIAEVTKEGAAADVVDAGLRAPGALDALLKRPAVYVHASAAELRDAAKRDGAAQESIKDAFLLCLVSPPASDAERDLLAKVQGVYFAGIKVDEQTANVRRLAEARTGLAVLGREFETAVLTAEEGLALKKLRKELLGAPTDQARKAATADLLIVVADDIAPGSARESRVSFVDLAAQKVLLQLQRRPIPPGRSAPAALHRDHLEGCALSLAVRRALQE